MSRTKILAHRGASAYAPENTMAAFELALEMGVQGIELDVQLSRDGKLVVIHDLTIERTSNGQGKVADLTLDELRQYDFSYSFSGKYGEAGSRIPELAEVLEFAKRSGLYINIETKDYSSPYGPVNARTAELIREMDYVENTLVSSINHHAMALLKRDFPEIKTAIAFLESFYCLDEYAAKCRADVLHPYHLAVDEPFMDLANRCGFEVNPWTADDVAEIKRLKALGVTRIMTNRPDLGLSS